MLIMKTLDTSASAHCTIRCKDVTNVKQNEDNER